MKKKYILHFISIPANSQRAYDKIVFLCVALSNSVYSVLKTSNTENAETTEFHREIPGFFPGRICRTLFANLLIWSFQIFSNRNYHSNINKLIFVY
jgi:hypothetical protein